MKETTGTTTQTTGVGKMAIKVKCPVCGNDGVLMQKTTLTTKGGKTYTYHKWYIYHNKSKGTKQKWCYLSKEYLETSEIKQAIEQLTTQNTTQNNVAITQTTKDLENLNLEALYQNSRQYRARSSARKSLDSAQSTGLLTRGSWVQFPPGPPILAAETW